MKSNRQLVCYWGSTGGWQLEETEDQMVVVPRIVRLSVRIAEVCCGEEHLLILGADSKAYLMGSNSKHQLGKDDTELVYNRPTLVSKLENFVVASLAAGWFHSVVVTDQGDVYSWGNDQDGVLGFLPSKLDHSPRRTSVLCDSATERIVRVSCGARHSILLSDQSLLYGFGDNEQHQLGLPQKKKYALPERISTNERIMHVACGTSHTLAIDSHQRIQATGLNNFGQLGTGNSQHLTKFSPIGFSKRFVAVSCGNHSAAISEEKELYIWGTGPFGQYFSPMRVNNQKVKRVWTGTTFGLAEGISGELYSWGSNVSGQLGHGNSQPYSTIERIGNLPIESIEDIACGSHSVLAVGQSPPSERPTKQYISLSQSNIETTQPAAKRNKGFEVLLSEQRHLESNYKLERQHKKNLEHINEQLRDRLTQLTDELSQTKQSNRQLLEDCSGLRSKLEAARNKQRQLLTELQLVRDRSEEEKSQFIESQIIESDLSATVKERQSQILSLQKQRVILEARIAQSQGRLQGALTTSKALQTINQQLQAKDQRLLNELNECKSQLEAATTKLSEGEKNIQEYILECYSLRAAVTQKGRQLTELQEAFQLTSDRVVRLQRQNLQLNKELSTAKLLSAGMPANSSFIDQSGWLQKASLQEIARQNEIEIHNYKKLLLMKDRQLTELRKRFNCHQQIETATPTGSSTLAQESCRYSLQTVELLEESQNHIAVFRQLLRDIHDGLESAATK